MGRQTPPRTRSIRRLEDLKMDERLKKLRKITEILRNKAIISEEKPREILRADIGYALPEEFPAPSLMRKTSPDEKWGGEKDFPAAMRAAAWRRGSR